MRGGTVPRSDWNRRAPWGQSAAAVALLMTAVASSIGVAVDVVATAVPAAADTTPGPTTFSPSGQCQLYVVPPDINQLTIAADGGTGAPGSGPGNPGGQGGTIQGTVDVESGATLYVIVGSNAGAGQDNNAGGSTTHGGAGGQGLLTWGTDSASYGGGGGGASFVSTDGSHCGTNGESVNPNDVLVVAGGGGGGGAEDYFGNDGGPGGNGGGTSFNGQNGGNSEQDCFALFGCSGGSNGGGAGTLSGGGSSGSNGDGPDPNAGSGESIGASPAGSGTSWNYPDGGSALTGDSYGGAGGGGWNGGGEGGDNLETFGGGGGGSNYAAPLVTNVATGTGATSPSVTITPLNTRELTVATNGTGSGTITSSDDPQTIDCGATCNGYYPNGATVTLTATPAPGDPGSRFAGWSGGGCSASTPTCTVDMTTAQDVTATFNSQQQLTYGIQQYGGTGSATITTSPPGVSCGSGCLDFDTGTLVTLTATPDSSSVLLSWICNGSLTASCTLTMNQAASAYADVAGNVLTVTADGTGSGVVTSSPSGITCAAGCSPQSERLPWDTTVTLTAQPTAGSTFEWIYGGCAEDADSLPPYTQPTCTVNMQGNLTVPVRFMKQQEPLTVSNDGGDGIGVVTSSPVGIDCSADQGCGSQTVDYDQYTAVTLTETPETGTASNDSVFSGWSGACSGTSTTCVVPMNQAQSVTAAFTRIPQYSLNAVWAGTGSGTVTSDVGGINCGATCTQNYYAGTVVTLTATPDSTSAFIGWSVPCNNGNSSTTCQLTVNGPITATATFAIDEETLTVSTAGAGQGDVSDDLGQISCSTSCWSDYDYGTLVDLTAVPASNVPTLFSGWTGPCTNPQPSVNCQVTMDEAQTVTATFTLNTYGVTVGVTGSGSGTVTANSDANGNAINCGGDCSGTFYQGELVTLTATPAQANSRFVGWSGVSGCTTATICSFEIDGASVAATADFALNTLTVNLAGGGSGTVTSGDSPQTIDCGVICMNNYPLDSVVTLTANPSAGSSFSAWTGNCINAQPAPTCQVTMATSQTVTATFTTSPKVTVVLAGSGAADGIVFNPGATEIDCGEGNTTCSVSLAPDTTVSLSSSVVGGTSVVFAGWSGPCTGTGTCSFTPGDSVTVTATFTLETNPLTVTVSGTGAGSVTSSPAGTINCGSTGTVCTANVPDQNSRVDGRLRRCGFVLRRVVGALHGNVDGVQRDHEPGTVRHRPVQPQSDLHLDRFPDGNR